MHCAYLPSSSSFGTQDNPNRFSCRLHYLEGRPSAPLSYDTRSGSLIIPSGIRHKYLCFREIPGRDTLWATILEKRFFSRSSHPFDMGSLGRPYLGLVKFGLVSLPRYGENCRRA